MVDIVERIKKRIQVDTVTGCWAWMGCKTSRGYGEIRFSGKMVGVHRIMYEAFWGPLRDNYCLHTCDNPSCVNPNHLFAGPQSVNIRDAMAKGRMRGFLRIENCCPKGEQQGNSMLTKRQILQIRREYSFGTVGYKKLSRKYGVSPSTIYDVIKQRTWKHVA